MPTLYKFRLARLNKGLSQKNVAEDLGMSQSNYSNIENGKHKKEVPPILIQRITDILKMDAPVAPSKANEEAPAADDQIIKKLEALESKMESVIRLVADFFTKRR